VSQEEVEQLRGRRGKRTDPVMEELLASLAAGRPQRVGLMEGQSGRGVRISIARRARERRLNVETVEGDRFVAVWRADEPATRRTRKTGGEGERRQGRPPKQQEAPQVPRDGMSKAME
jgi:hypothetical protein